MVDVTQNEAVVVVKRKPGRPRKNPLPVVVTEGEQPVVKRKRGRPRKNPLPIEVAPEVEVVKRGRGRPRKDSLPVHTESVAILKANGSGRGPVYHNGFLHLSPLDKALLERAQLGYQLAEKDIALLRTTQEKVENELQAKFAQMKLKEKQLVCEAARQEAALQTIREEIERDYKIAIDSITFDPDTGQVKKAGSPVPAS
jgi:hypothetical protein